MINNHSSNKGYSQRQLRVGELVKQGIGEIFIKNETKISYLTRIVTVTEVRMTPDLKTARVYVIPLGGIDMKEIVGVLTDNAHLVRKALSKKLSLKFLQNSTLLKTDLLNAEKIEKLIKENKNDSEKRYNEVTCNKQIDVALQKYKSVIE